MTALDIVRHRIANQQIARTHCATPAEVVAWLGAVQAQDYRGSLWAIGLRLPHATETAIEQAIANRTIIRTWPMRGTLHFVAAADIRWMLQLLTPRMIAGSAHRWRQLELDDAVFARSKAVVVTALQGGKQLSRPALYQLLAANDISPAGQRGIHILGRLAQESLICFGPRAGKQPAFVLLDEWAPRTKKLERDEALAEIARRYFTSHGPATLQDFIWWSGLLTADARAGLSAVTSELVQATVDGQTYWMAPDPPTVENTSPSVYLLPAYDEYTVAYKDRGAVLDPLYARQASGNGIFYPTIIVDGRVVGTWKRSFKKDAVVITSQPFHPFTDAARQAVVSAANRYGNFLNLPATLS